MGIGLSTGVSYQGSYLMDIGAGTAEIVERTQSGQPTTISMISVNDVGRFLVAAIALDPQTWPGEFRMQGDRRTVTEVLQWAEAVRGGENFLLFNSILRHDVLTYLGAVFSTDIIEPGDLAAHLQHATYYQDWIKVNRIQELIATEQRRYDFVQPNLNALVNVTPTPFWDWLKSQWGGQ